jgi:3'-phosphoadenosine 5'-phosphosulfate sulfotransferase (PAPS reductase)/FAD synthetase
MLNRFITVPPMAFIGDENAGCAPTPLKRESTAMTERHPFKQTEIREHSLAEEAAKLRKEARGTPPGIERERLLRRARQAETASRMNEWLTSPGLQSPK